MGLVDLFTGARPDIRLPGFTEGLISDIRNDPGLNPGIGRVGKSAKQYIKRIDRGDDVSDLGYFNTIAQQAATERRDIEEDYLTGSNALVSQYGGPQATLLQRIKEMALDKSRERQGMRNVEALSDLRRQSADQLQRANDTQYDQLLRKYGLIGQLMNSSSYDARRRGGIFNPDTIAGLAQSFVGGLGAAVAPH